MSELAIAQNKLGDAARSLASATSIMRVVREELEHLERHGNNEAKVKALREQIRNLESETTKIRSVSDELA